MYTVYPLNWSMHVIEQRRRVQTPWEYHIMWKSRGGILVNIVPTEFQGQKPEWPQAPEGFWPWNLLRDNIH